MVFLTSRIYGGYANLAAQGQNGRADQCLSPEPFSYEQGFAVQRLITAQIRQSNGIQNPVDAYAGQVDYSMAPWVDWGPYLWANGENLSSAGIRWCNYQQDQACGTTRDFRDGDRFGDSVMWWGDYTHPSATAAGKVADQLVFFIGNSAFVTPWIHKNN